MIEEYKHGSGDIHSLVAQLIYPELKGLTTAEIKKQHKDLRQKAKPVGLGINYGAAAPKLAETIGCSIETAQKYYDAYMSHFTGVRDYMKKADKFVKDNGYILICPETGHKAWWPEWGSWKAESLKYTREFWEEYKMYHKGTGDSVAQEVREHTKEGSNWSRKAVNTPCQGLSAIITKVAMINFFRWIVDNKLFGEVRLVDAVHDEIVITFPESMKDTVPAKLKEIMEAAGNHFCKKVNIVAEPEVSTYWVH
jgi:DNA polymerase-1